MITPDTHDCSVNRPRTPRRAPKGEGESPGTGPRKGGRTPPRDAHTPRAIRWVRGSLVSWGERNLNHQRTKHLSEHMALGSAKIRGQRVTLLLLWLLISAGKTCRATRGVPASRTLEPAALRRAAASGRRRSRAKPSLSSTPIRGGWRSRLRGGFLPPDRQRGPRFDAPERMGFAFLMRTPLLPVGARALPVRQAGVWSRRSAAHASACHAGPGRRRRRVQNTKARSPPAQEGPRVKPYRRVSPGVFKTRPSPLLGPSPRRLPLIGAVR